MVFFPDEPDVGLPTIKQYYLKMEEGSVLRGIVVVQKRITPIAKKVVESFRGPEKWCQVERPQDDQSSCHCSHSFPLFSFPSLSLFLGLLQAMADMAQTAKNYTMEQFLESELLVNITQHLLVPEHKVLTFLHHVHTKGKWGGGRRKRRSNLEALFFFSKRC
jgi:hypothetical protein